MYKPQNDHIAVVMVNGLLDDLNRVLALGFILFLGLSGCTRYDSRPFLAAYNYSLTCTQTQPKDVTRLGPGIDDNTVCPSVNTNASSGGAVVGQGSTSTQSTTTETDVKKTVATAGGIKTTTTTTTTTLPAPASMPLPGNKPTPPKYYAIKACPDSPGTVMYTPASSNTAPGGSDTTPPKSPGGSATALPGFSPCAAAIIRSAINYCVRSTLTQDFEDTYLQEGEVGFTTATTAAASGIAAVAGATAPISLGIGLTAGIITAAGSSLSKILPTPPTATIGNMITAGEQYLEITGDMTTASNQPNPPSPAFDSTDPLKLKPTDTSWRYYAGLWNAVGSACAPDVFKKVTNPKCTEEATSFLPFVRPRTCP
jgi:hypothetical protein